MFMQLFKYVARGVLTKTTEITGCLHPTDATWMVGPGITREIRPPILHPHP